MGHSPSPHETLHCCTWDPVSLSPAGTGICPRAQRAVNQLRPPNECSISEVGADAPAWELTAFPESGVCRKTCADTHHAAPGTSVRVRVGWIARGGGDNGTHRIPSHWDAKAGPMHLGKLSADLLPSAFPPCSPAMCSSAGKSTPCVHRKYTPGGGLPSLCTHRTPCMGTRVPTIRCKDPHSKLSILPRPSRSPHFPVKGSIRGQTPLPTRREWLGSRVKFIIIILISSPGLTVAAAKENTKA